MTERQKDSKTERQKERKREGQKDRQTECFLTIEEKMFFHILFDPVIMISLN
jgi:hypothetical protein